MTEDKDDLIREMSEKIKSLEEKEKNRISTPWGVFDKKTYNVMVWFQIGILVVVGIGIGILIFSDDPFIFLPNT